jgi:hypothetical protein
MNKSETETFEDRAEQELDLARTPWAAGRRLRALPENQKLPLAHERTPLP